ncbi:hypothetical protein IA57_11480 [Mangrovimonas yunxiaonensis]|uniref:DUF4249 domain-containing protein n=1 Tax=Mangrovimonas yunxiaonensis TaxID=1197477 RepID=A0A084THW7_9FLAO|nr:DUF4249 domain-containing protein [Mangrovimonas yunxiaonensis]KFB00303.1 hypothetical protein IA57_11480 [Mangrovimonas yunxiaonensis]
MKKIITLLVCCFYLVGCKEPFEPKSYDFESYLVVEGNLTNELKKQQITLSKTYELTENNSPYVNNATVWVEDDTGVSHTYSYTENGIYESEIAFQAEQNKTYQLFISTPNGELYTSEEVSTPPTAEITTLYPEYNNNENEINILLDANITNETAKFFRYEYIETYKIIVPHWYDIDFEIINFETDPYNSDFISYDIVFNQRDPNERVCYSTINSTGIIQTSTKDLETNNIFRFPVRILDENDLSLTRERYSILVKQFVQNESAYNYYNTLNELGNTGDILSPNQPGYIKGNISLENNPEKRVLGFFEVTTLDSERIYFDHTLYSNEKPAYLYACDIWTYDYAAYDFPNERLLLSQRYNLGYKLLHFSGGNIYTIVNPECGDCTSFSSSVEPDFWEE